MAHPFTDADLEAYLDESLSVEDCAQIEKALRAEPQLTQRLAAILARRDAGVHSLGEIWRRRRLSCPTREQLGSFLLEALDDGHADYIRFHLAGIGCRACQANLDDLRREQAADGAASQTRRRKFFESSAGRLRVRK